jgi:hypothetical protein
MPKGDNPNSRKNLDKSKGKRFTVETASENGKKGAAKSNEVQARNRSIQERARIVLNTLINRKNGEKIDMFSAGCEKAAAQWVVTGDPKYGKALAELAGQFTQKVEQVVITPEVDFDKLADLRNALRDDD